MGRSSIGVWEGRVCCCVGKWEGGRGAWGLNIGFVGPNNFGCLGNGGFGGVVSGMSGRMCAVWGKDGRFLVVAVVWCGCVLE